jgi:membrane protein implicated in regulation of membrane protease activity
VIEAVFFLVALLAAIYLLAPTFRRTALPSSDPHVSLEAAQAAALRSLHDLELDWGTGKLSDEDYRAQRAVLEAELAAIVRKMSGGPPAS